MKRGKKGLCRICGQVAEMTEEHLIPQSSGNKGETWAHTFESLSRRLPKGWRFKRGLALSTLCEQCNNQGGRYYCEAFKHWTQQAQAYHEREASTIRLLLPFHVMPLPIAKQVAVMALAFSAVESFRLPSFDALRAFVRNPALSLEPHGFRLYVYLHYGAAAFAPIFHAASTDGGPSPTLHCQVGREPLGYVVTSDDAASVQWAVDRGLCDITRFCTRPYRAFTTEHLDLSRLRGALPFAPLLQAEHAALSQRVW